jgi:hypothetical protein
MRGVVQKTTPRVVCRRSVGLQSVEGINENSGEEVPTVEVLAKPLVKLA